MIRLYGSTARVSLVDGLRRSAAYLAAQGRPVVFLYAPDRFRIGILEPNGSVAGPDGTPFDLTLPFEARAFTEKGEFRWLHEAKGIGRAVVLSEHEDASTVFEGRMDTLEIIDRSDQEYLLWGRGTGESPYPGWSRLFEVRIGPLDVPVADLGEQQEVRLRTVEYLMEADEHGNVVVGEERLIGLEVVKNG